MFVVNILCYAFLLNRPDRIDAAREYLATQIMHNDYEDDPEDEAVRVEIFVQTLSSMNRAQEILFPVTFENCT